MKNMYSDYDDMNAYAERNSRLEHRLLQLLALTFLLLLLTLAASCERRELYVYGDEFHDAFLEVDWSEYDGHRPDGMTAWFYPGPAGQNFNKPYRHTTADVDHYDLYLSGGLYQGMVVDYSPEEFGKVAVSLLEYRMEISKQLPDDWGRMFKKWPCEVGWWRAPGAREAIQAKYPEIMLRN